MKKIIVILVMFSFLISCLQNDVENLSIKGLIKDSSTNEFVVVKKEEFKIECWKKGDSEGESYGDFERINLATNNQGEFSKNFDKGALVIFIIKAKGYKKFVKKIYMKKSDNFSEINLIPIEE